MTSASDFPIFPTPRSVTFRPGPSASRDAVVNLIEDNSLPPQGYRLDAGATAINLSYKDDAGRRYGEDTLRQLRSSSAIELGGILIEDWPDFSIRGYMLDISRDRVPNRRELKRLVGFLSRARYNQLELYTEHTFAYRDHPDVWEAASPLTPQDVHWLDALCAREGIALVCNQNSLGHMERWLEHATYADRAEAPGGVDLVSEVLPSTTLAPTRENAQFVSDLLDEVLPNYREKRVNIGCDEPWELGRGSSAERVDEFGVGAVYAEYVRRIAEPLIDEGYQVEYWADVIAGHPDAFGMMPTGMIPLVWMYNSPRMMRAIAAQNDPVEEAGHAAHGIVIRDLLNGFRDRAQSLLDRGLPFWVCPGTNAWRSLTGRLDEARLNLIDAAEVGLEAGSDGYLVTHWGNQGAWDAPVISIPPLVAGAGYSWCLQSNRDTDLATVIDRRFVGDPNHALGSAMCSVGHIPELLDLPVLNTSPLWVVLQAGGRLPARHTPSSSRLAEAREVLLAASDQVDRSNPMCEEAETLKADLRFTIDLARFAVDLIDAGMGETISPTAQQSAQLLTKLEALLFRHVERWAATARFGGLPSSLQQLEPLRRRLQRLAAHAD